MSCWQFLTLAYNIHICYINWHIIDAIKIVHPFIIGYFRLTMVTYMKRLAFRSTFLPSYKSL